MVDLTLPTILRPDRHDEALERLADYFRRVPYAPHTAEGFTGACFETIGTRWDDPKRADVVTADDIVAVSCLAVKVPARAAIRILGADAAQISALLTRIPSDLDLVDASETEIGDRSAAQQLWAFLRRYDGMGPTTTSKLLARKRARLAPVFDRVVAKELGLSGSAGHWASMRSLLQSPADPHRPGDRLHDRLTLLAEEAALDPVVTPLRVFDTLVWHAGMFPGSTGA